MRRLGFAAIVFLLAGGVAALAQGVAYIYTPLGYQQISPVTSNTLLTVPQTARIAQICVNTNAVRYRDDGVIATTALGIPVSGATFPICFQYSGNLTAINFVQLVSPAVLDVAYYR